MCTSAKKTHFSFLKKILQRKMKRAVYAVRSTDDSTLLEHRHREARKSLTSWFVEPASPKRLVYKLTNLIYNGSK